MRVAVYTSIIENYDCLSNPHFIDEGYDYFCLTDNPKITDGTIWQPLIKNISTRDASRQNRYHKMMPHLFFPDYDMSLYIDGRIRIKGTLKPLVENSLGETNISFRKHPDRSCLYEEAARCIKKRLDNPNIIRKQILKYMKEHYPKSNGLVNGGIILRKHNNPNVIAAMNLWWDEVLRFSKRDQISLNYVLWKKRLNFSCFNSKLLKDTLHIGEHIKK